MTIKRKKAIIKELKTMAISWLIGLGFISIFAIGLWIECQRYINFW